MTDVARLAHPRAVFLDIGGPIYDDENFFRAVRRGLDELRAERGLEPADADGVRRVYDEMRALQSGSIRRRLAAEYLGDESLARELGPRTKKHWNHPPGTLMKDVPAFLEAIHGRTVTAVVANQEADVVDSLVRDGIAPLIDVWGVSALVGYEKPSRELFEWALDKAGVRPDEAVHIGNRLDTDVRPARALGIGTVWIVRGEAPDDPTPEQLAEPDLAVRSLAGLESVLFP